MIRLAYGAMALLAALLSACITPPKTADSNGWPVLAAGEAVPLRPELVADGMPQVPKSLAAAVDRYSDFRGHSFLDWHPTKREMLVSFRKPGSSAPQVFRVAQPMAEPEALTDGNDVVSRASYEPRTGRYIVLQRSASTGESPQLVRLDLPERRTTVLTEASERHQLGPWLKRGSGLLFTSASPNDANKQVLSLIDPAKPDETREIARLPGSGWRAAAVSFDDRYATLVRTMATDQQEVWIVSLRDGRLGKLFPSDGDNPRSVFDVGGFSRDNTSLILSSNRRTDFRQPERIVFSAKRGTPVTQPMPADLDGLTLSADQKYIALRANVEGRHELHVLDTARGNEVRMPELPRGSIASVNFHPSRTDLAFSVNSAQSPSQVYSFDPRTGAVEQWTRGFAPTGVDTAAIGDQYIAHWKSFDETVLSAIVNMPPARFAGKRPVLVVFHSAPEGQATFGFISRFNYLVNELGIAIIQPNVRGSGGFGRRFEQADDGPRRMDSIKDVGTLLAWIATQPSLDASRVMLSGGDYGAYLAMAASAQFPERVAGTIDAAGMLNLASYLQNADNARREAWRIEFGDERDPAIRDFLLSISPLTGAKPLAKPLFVIAGRNDPRIPYTDADQIVAKTRAAGVPVWYLRGETEGHGFTNKENADYQFYATVMFAKMVLLRP